MWLQWVQLAAVILGVFHIKGTITRVTRKHNSQVNTVIQWALSQPEIKASLPQDDAHE